MHQRGLSRRSSARADSAGVKLEPLRKASSLPMSAAADFGMLTWYYTGGADGTRTIAEETGLVSVGKTF